MKVGRIIKVERVADTEKLYKLQVDIKEKNIQALTLNEILKKSKIPPEILKSPKF